VGAESQEVLSDADTALRASIIQHCRMLYKLDPDYAEWAFDQYAKGLPWLNLTRKK
jgi:hypothetical protein